MKAIKIRPNDMGAFNRSGRHDYPYHLPYHARGCSTFYNSLPVNQRTLINIFGYLRQYANHGTRVMARRYKTAERRFMNRHMANAGRSRNTCRFVNEYTAHRWM